MKKRKGFTLIELMIVMAVIAILATAGIQAYTGYVKKSRDTARAQIANNLNTAVMSYAASNGGNPPADQNAFDTFLATSGEYFGGSGVTGTALVEDPVGGAEVCLDAAGNANQPCAFNYTAYDDGTYAISYGVEHESSTEGNFYKTTASVPAADATDPNAAAVPKYGVYVGSAKYIGQPATTQNTLPGFNYTPGEDNDGVDETYTPPGALAPVALVPIFRSIRVDVPTSSGGGGTPTCSPACTNGNDCTSVNNCTCGGGTACTGNDTCVNNTSCVTPPPTCGNGLTVGGYATVVAENGTCWLATDLPGYYQWMRNVSGWTFGWTASNSHPEYGDPCPAGSRLPTQGEWANLFVAFTAEGIDRANNGILQLPISGYFFNGTVYFPNESYHWSSTKVNTTHATHLFFHSTFVVSDNWITITSALPVRCIVN